MKPKISIITLGVTDFQKQLAFYRDGLGFPTHEYKDDAEIVFFKLEGTWLSLYPREKLAEDIGLPASDPSGTNITLAHNVKSQTEVIAVVDRAVDAGAKLIKKPQKVFWGGFSGYFQDPEGNLWEVAHNPFMDLT